MDKPISYYAFELLYWCGVREGELLALSPSDFNFEKRTLRINKSYQRLEGEDVISTPKTKNSNRIVKMPQFLCDEMQDFSNSITACSQMTEFSRSRNIIFPTRWIVDVRKVG